MPAERRAAADLPQAPPRLATAPAAEHTRAQAAGARQHRDVPLDGRGPHGQVIQRLAAHERCLYYPLVFSIRVTTCRPGGPEGAGRPDVGPRLGDHPALLEPDHELLLLAVRRRAHGGAPRHCAHPAAGPRHARLIFEVIFVVFM